MYEYGGKMNKYDIVFMDIDNLNYLNISSYTKQVIQKLKRQGIKVVLSTSNSASYALAQSQAANLSEYVICANGAEVYNYRLKKALYSKPIAKDTLKGIYEYCQSHNLILLLYSFKNQFSNLADYSYNGDHFTYFTDINHLLTNYQINEIVIISSNYNRMLALPNLFKAKFPAVSFYNLSPTLISPSSSNKEYAYKIVATQTTKNTGIIKLLDYLNIASERVVIIGNHSSSLASTNLLGITTAFIDNYNDLKDTSYEDNLVKILEQLCLNK